MPISLCPPEEAPIQGQAWVTPAFLSPTDDAHGIEQRFAPDLPQNVLRSIASNLTIGEQPGNVLLNMLSMAGVCTAWRRVARDLNSGVCLGFDGQDTAFSSQPMMPQAPSAQRLRRLNATVKESVFLAAARLFTGTLSPRGGQ